MSEPSNSEGSAIQYIVLGQMQSQHRRYEIVTTHFVAQHRSLNPVPKKMKGDRETKDSLYTSKKLPAACQQVAD